MQMTENQEDLHFGSPQIDEFHEGQKWTENQQTEEQFLWIIL